MSSKGGALAPGSTGDFSFTTPLCAIGHDYALAGRRDFYGYASGSIHGPVVSTINMSLTMPGGPYVPVNANDDNGSPITNEIPTTRDFNYTDALPEGDPQLQLVNISVDNLNQLTGNFVIYIQPMGGTGQIRLWTTPNKQVDGRSGLAQIPNGTVFTKDTLPSRIWVEGLNPSTAVPDGNGGLTAQPDNRIRLTYYGCSANVLPLQFGTATQDVEVTPVITRFDMRPGAFDSILVQGPNNPNNFYVRGVQTVAGNGNLAGMTFDAILDRHNLQGDMIYNQNAGIPGGDPAIVNSNGLLGGGFVSTAAPNSINAILIDAAGNQQSRVLDRPGYNHLPGEPPDYYRLGDPVGFPNSTSPGEGIVERIAYDMPSVAIDNTVIANNFAFIRGLTDIYVEENYRMYVVWRYPAGGVAANSVIYTVGTRDWRVIFDVTGVQGNINFNGCWIGPIGPFDPNNHANPIVVRPDFNDLLNVH